MSEKIISRFNVYINEKRKKKSEEKKPVLFQIMFINSTILFNETADVMKRKRGKPV